MAVEYDRRHPEVDIPDGQKVDRMERRAHGWERALLRRTNRTRGIVVPSLPWLEDKET